MPETRGQARRKSSRERRAQKRDQRRRNEEAAVQPRRRHNVNIDELEQHVEEVIVNNDNVQQHEFDRQEEEHIQHDQEEVNPNMQQQNQDNVQHGPQALHPLVYQFLQYRKHRPKPRFVPQGLFCGSPNNANGRPLGSPYQCLRKGFGASSSSFIRDLDAFFHEMNL